MARPLPEPKKAEILSLEEAVKKYTYDGMTIGFSGFTAGTRNPVAFAWEMIRQERKDLHCIDRHGSVCTFLLNAAKRMRIYETDWYGWGELAGKLDLNFERRYKEGSILAEEYAHGATAFRMLAGALGIPFIPYYAPMGSDLYNPEYDRLGKEGLRDGSNPRIPKKKFDYLEDPFYGDGKVVLLPAARPEVAVIHVGQAGEKGTARWRGVASLDKELALAADKVIIVCEEIVPESMLRQYPESNQIPYFIVDCIVELPFGAYPTGNPYYYDYDMQFMQQMQAASRTEEGMNQWLDEWVFGPKDWRDFLNKLGANKIADLRADSLTGYSSRIMRGKKPAPKMFEPLSVAKFGY